VTAGGWLLASPENTRLTSVSAFCASCWASLDDAELERFAMQVLHTIKPGARFAP